MKVLALWHRNDYVDIDGREDPPTVDGLYASIDAINRNSDIRLYGLKFEFVDQRLEWTKRDAPIYVGTRHWWIEEMEVTE